MLKISHSLSGGKLSSWVKELRPVKRLSANIFWEREGVFDMDATALRFLV